MAARLKLPRATVNLSQSPEFMHHIAIVCPALLQNSIIYNVAVDKAGSMKTCCDAAAQA